MAKLAIRKNSPETGGKSVIFWCPGCDEAHVFWIERDGRPCWKLTSPNTIPTVTPSIRLFRPANASAPEHTYCHLIIDSGMIKYCSDCDHELKGKTVPMQDIPDDYAIPNDWKPGEINGS